MERAGAESLGRERARALAGRQRDDAEPARCPAQRDRPGGRPGELGRDRDRQAFGLLVTVRDRGRGQPERGARGRLRDVQHGSGRGCRGAVEARAAVVARPERELADAEPCGRERARTGAGRQGDHAQGLLGFGHRDRPGGCSGELGRDRDRQALGPLVTVGDPLGRQPQAGPGGRPCDGDRLLSGRGAFEDRASAVTCDEVLDSGGESCRRERARALGRR